MKKKMKNFPSLPAVQAAFDYIRRGLAIYHRSPLEESADREMAANFDVDKALREALAARASLKNIPDEPNKL